MRSRRQQGYCSHGGAVYRGKELSRLRSMSVEGRVPCPGCGKPVKLRVSLVGALQQMIPQHKAKVTP